MNGHEHDGRVCVAEEGHIVHTEAAAPADDETMARGHEGAARGTEAHQAHGGHGAHGHGDHAAMFRDRFWWSLLLTIPVVAYSEMVQEWLRFTPPEFPGSDWVAPVLGTVVFLYGGRPFLEGGLAELRSRQPGMMLLISLAIVVAYTASLATSLGWFDLEFWWELAALITIMLLGHWQEMKAVGQASSALEALAELLPDEAERVTDSGTETVAVNELAQGDVVLVRPGERGVEHQVAALALGIPAVGHWLREKFRSTTQERVPQRSN
jgi:P-type Cu2+ transporter